MDHLTHEELDQKVKTAFARAYLTRALADRQSLSAGLLIEDKLKLSMAWNKKRKDLFCACVD